MHTGCTGCPLFSTLDSLLKHSSNWKCSIKCTGFTQKSQLKAKEVDICDLMHQPPLNRDSVHWNSSFMFDPLVFKGNDKDTMQRIQAYVVGSCKDAGFYLKPTSACRRHKIGRRLAVLDFVCEHNAPPVKPPSVQSPPVKPAKAESGNKQKKSTKTKKERKIFTTRAVNEEDRCPFGLRIFCCEEDQHWYLTNSSTAAETDGTHKGHFALPPETVRIPISEADESCIELALHAQEMALPDSQIAQLLELQTNGSKRFSSSQIRYLIERHKSEKIVKDFQSRELSSAETLLESFDKLIAEGEDLSYVALVQSKEHGFELKFPKGRHKSISDPADLDMAGIRRAMSVGKGQSVLLAFAWITGEERKMLEKFPELITFDVTENTNKEKRGLFVGTGQDGNGKLFIALHSFMPNAQIICE